MAADWRMKGDYLKTCSCAAGCPCDFWAPPTEHLCEGVIAMRIVEGHFGPTKLNGLVWAGAFHWPGPLHEGNGTLQPYVDATANDAQRQALLTILSGKAGGAWFEVVASLVKTVLEPKFAPIQFVFDLAARSGRCSVPGEFDVTAEPIRDLEGKDVSARIVLPKGIEYFSADVARTTMLKSTGKIKFNRSATHASFSAVDHTPAGVK